MPIAKKTKSGNYRCRTVDHYEYHDGKRKIVYRSFTAPSKAEAEQRASEYQVSKDEIDCTDMTVAQALDRYLAAKENILSPSTYESYISYRRTAFTQIENKRIRSLRSEDLQRWVNDYRTQHSPKTCRNAKGLLLAAITLQRPNAHFTVTMPQKIPPELYTPTDDDIKTLLDHIQGTELEKAVLLSAFGTLRRGEVCAITYDDIHGDEIRINKSLVYSKERGWFVKTTKTPQSIRTVKYPHFVIERILRDKGSSDRVVNLVPDTITDAHRYALRRIGLPHFRFHDLRAYAVSIRHAIGIPDVYIMQDGGYKTDTVMKQIYRRTMSDKQREFADQTAAHFDSVFAK